MVVLQLNGLNRLFSPSVSLFGSISRAVVELRFVKWAELRSFVSLWGFIDAVVDWLICDKLDFEDMDLERAFIWLRGSSVPSWLGVGFGALFAVSRLKLINRFLFLVALTYLFCSGNPMDEITPFPVVDVVLKGLGGMGTLHPSRWRSSTFWGQAGLMMLSTGLSMPGTEAMVGKSLAGGLLTIVLSV